MLAEAGVPMHASHMLSICRIREMFELYTCALEIASRVHMGGFPCGHKDSFACRACTARGKKEKIVCVCVCRKYGVYVERERERERERKK